MLAIRSHLRIIVMVAVLILAPIILSILVTQYESCKFIKKDCASLIPAQNYVKPGELNQFLDEVVCVDTKPDATPPVYKDLNTGKCYTFVAAPGSSPPPSNANLVWIGGDKDANYLSYKEFVVSSKSGWQDTGISLNKGDAVEINSSGIIKFDSSGRNAIPDGYSGAFLAEKNSVGICRFLLCKETLPAWTLVGRIGAADLIDYTSGFNIGSHYNFVAENSGNLFLGFNDEFVSADRSGLDGGGVGDNQGDFKAFIKISKK